jgi:EmrB/QacA subfamily drug resistance transporter
MSDSDARDLRHILWIMSATTSIVALDTSIVGLALPSIAHSLHATFTGIEWVISGYVICFAALLLPAGTFVDYLGRKRGVIAGTVIFAVASLWCGLATSVYSLVAARVLQGIGGALLPSSSLAVIGHSFRGPARKHAFAVWGIALGIAIAAGPVAGGLLTALLGWRWIFLINVPLCLILGFFTILWIPESRDENAGRFDVAGCITYAAALALLTFALIEGNVKGWTSRPVLMCFTLAAFLLILFVIAERRHSRPMMDLSLFGRTDFIGAAIAMAGYAACGQVMIFLLPLLIQTAFGFSPLRAGFAMLPFAFPLFVAPRAGSYLSSHFSGRVSLTVGLLLLGVGNLCLAAILPVASYPMLACAMLLSGCGAGILNGETARVLQETIPLERSGMASGLSAATRFSALLLAVAVLGIVLSHFTSSSLASVGVPVQDLPNIVKHLTAGDISGALQASAEQGRSLTEDQARRGFVHGFSFVLLFSGIWGLLGAGSTWFFLRGTRESLAPAELAPVVH